MRLRRAFLAPTAPAPALAGPARLFTSHRAGARPHRDLTPSALARPRLRTVSRRRAAWARARARRGLSGPGRRSAPAGRPGARLRGPAESPARAAGGVGAGRAAALRLHPRGPTALGARGRPLQRAVRAVPFGGGAEGRRRPVAPRVCPAPGPARGLPPPHLELGPCAALCGPGSLGEPAAPQARRQQFCVCVLLSTGAGLSLPPRGPRALPPPSLLETPSAGVSPHPTPLAAPAGPGCLLPARPVGRRTVGSGGCHQAPKLRVQEPSPGALARGAGSGPTPGCLTHRVVSGRSETPAESWAGARGDSRAAQSRSGSGCGLLFPCRDRAGNTRLSFPRRVLVRSCTRQARGQSRHLEFIGNPPSSPPPLSFCGKSKSLGQSFKSQGCRDRWSGVRGSKGSLRDRRRCGEGPVLPRVPRRHRNAHL
nr:translation initiation factor IF-2-like [Mirounga angustirostris]XP_054365070.1 translation initiation factor IF-2-like [Mirounga angustirostris]